MTEPQPSESLSEPTVQYRHDVEVLLDGMFDVPIPEQDERLEVPLEVRHRTWANDGSLFLAMATNTGIEALDESVNLVRLSTESEGMHHLRTYRYSRTTGQMYTVDEALPEEEITSMFYLVGEDNSRRRAVDEMIELGLCAASTTDYRDFLKDLAGYQYSLWG